MSEADEKRDLLRYLQHGRDAVLWKLEGLSEYDMRRPMTPTGTNLLGIVKHLCAVEIGYLGDTFSRPYGGWVPRFHSDDHPNADMWAAPDEPSAKIVELYRSVWRHAGETIEALPLDATGRVPWWPAERAEVTLHHVVVRVSTDTNRHAGHADIVRELIDGATGWELGNENLASADEAWWLAYRERLEEVAHGFGA